MSGIAAAFFMLERGRLLSAAGFAASMMVLAMCIEPEGTGAVWHRKLIIRYRQVLVIMLLLGMMTFTARYAFYGYAEYAAADQTMIRGRVISCVPADDKLKLTLRSELSGRPEVLITWKYFDPDQDYSQITGADIEAAGQFRDVTSADNPGCFDYRVYLRGKGCGLSFKAENVKVTADRASLLIRVRRYLYRGRERFIGRFDDGTAGFIRGVIFGDKRDIDNDLIEEFNSNSTGHILAVSGLHIGFLFGLLKFLTGRRRTPALSAIVIAVLITYGEMTMWSAATVRACLVASASIVSMHVRRRFDLLSSVCFAALCILIKEPYQLFDAGFQLSFLAMAGISIVTKPVTSVAGEAIGVAAAVQLGTVPVAALCFNCFEPFALFINIPVILLASVLVPLCIIMLIAELAAGAVPSAGIGLAELISYAVINTNHLLAEGSGPPLKTAGFGPALTVLYYLALFGLSSEWSRVLILRNSKQDLMKLGALMLLPVIMISSCMYDRLADDEIVFVAVGQGDCTHIRADGINILIDGGGDPGYGSNETGGKREAGDTGDTGRDSSSEKADDKNDGYNVGRNILMPYLLHSGAGSVDTALVTHLHADHYKGIAELAEELPVGAIGIPIDYRGDKEIISSYEPERILYIRPDTKIGVSDDVYIEVLWPVTVSRDRLAADDPNEHNTVYMIHYGGIRIMVTGDLLEEDELNMVKYYEGTDRLKCDVLKVAHHGSKSSSSEAFLDAASPSVAVIQCGRNNFYGHPHKQTLERLEERGIQVLRTDISGAVGIDIRNDKVFADVFKAPPDAPY